MKINKPSPKDFEMTEYNYTKKKEICLVSPDDRRIIVERDFCKYDAESDNYDIFTFLDDFSDQEIALFYLWWDNGEFEDMIEW